MKSIVPITLIGLMFVFQACNGDVSEAGATMAADVAERAPNDVSTDQADWKSNSDAGSPTDNNDTEGNSGVADTPPQTSDAPASETENLDTVSEDSSEVLSADNGSSDVSNTEDDADSSKAEDTGVSVVNYPLDDVLRINHIQAKGTHNSYHIKPIAGGVVPDWNYTHDPLDVQLGTHGVRQVELDIHVKPEGGYDVFHIPVVDAESTCSTFTKCLQVMKDWSDKNPGHHVLFILIEPKDEVDIFKIDDYEAVDQTILEVWPPERLIRPDDVKGDYATLKEALANSGWPTLGESRNKAMFLMLDEGKHRDSYLDTFPQLKDAVIFMRGGSDEGWVSFVEHNDPIGAKGTIDSKAQAGLLVRSDADDAKSSGEDNQKKAAASVTTGAHFISSDIPGEPTDDSYWFSMPDGNPSRCNPVTAPPECTAKDIENLVPASK